jgi:hypothetical protein
MSELQRARLSCERDKNAKLVIIANDYRRGMLTERDYCDWTTLAVLEWFDARADLTEQLDCK